MKKISSNGWIYFKDNFKSDPKNFFSEHKIEFNLSKDDEMRLEKEIIDSIFKFVKFNRFYKGLLVEGSGYTLKYKNDILELAIGKVTEKIDIDVNNLVSSESALQEALRNTHADKFAWEDPKWQSLLREDNSDSSASWFPKERLVITKTKNGEFRLAYVFDILAVQPEINNGLWYIDARSGLLIKEIPLEFNAIGTGVTTYNGAQSFTTHQDGDYKLQDRTRGILTAKMNQYVSDTSWNNASILIIQDQ